MPKITVYIVTSNRLEKLKRAIDSVESQTYRDFELVVVDNGSSDGTNAFLSSYRSTVPFRFIRNEQNLGAPAARNQAIAMAEGEFVTGLDDDDQFMPSRLDLMIRAWSEDTPIVGAQDILIFSHRNVRWRKPELLTLDDILYKNSIGNQILTRKEYIQAVGGFDESLVAAQDYDLWIRLMTEYSVAYIVPYPLQKIDMTASEMRITNNSLKSWGYFDCYKKHRHLMNRRQRKYQLYSIRSSQKKFSWSDFCMMVPLKFWRKELAKKILNSGHDQ